MTTNVRDAVQQALNLATRNGGDYGVGVDVGDDVGYVQWVRQEGGTVDLEVGIYGDQPALSAAVRAQGFAPSDMDFGGVDHVVRSEVLSPQEHLDRVEELLRLLGADGSRSLKVYPD